MVSVMPEPLATTKRKFHKLLDSLTKHANATTTPPPGEPQKELSARQRLILASERVSKRQRVDSERGTSSTPPSIQSSPSSRGVIRPPVRPPSDTTHTASQQPLPAFSPWSQASFLDRLKTFSSVALWHPKPEAINEVAWAKRGWRCVAVNTVACVGGCEQRVTVDLQRQRERYVTAQDNQHDPKHVQSSRPSTEPISIDDGDDLDDNDDSVLQAFSRRYEEEVIRGHSDTCLWRRAGCKDDIYRLQVVRPAVWKPQLHERYASLLRVHDSISKINCSSGRDARFNDEVEGLLASMESGNGVIESTDQTIRKQATDIAMHGWYGAKESHADLLQCQVCFQRVGLWMYQPGYHRRGVSIESNELTADDDKEQGLALDLLNMHREYCPWRNADSQCASGSLSGLNACEILARVVGTFLREHRRNVSDVAAPDDEGTFDSTAKDDLDLGTTRPSPEEVDRLDREREGKLLKLKRLLTLKRPRKVEQPG